MCTRPPRVKTNQLVKSYLPTSSLLCFRSNALLTQRVLLTTGSQGLLDQYAEQWPAVTTPSAAGPAYPLLATS